MSGHQETINTCAAYERALAAGEHPTDIVGELARQYGVQRPAIWRRLISGGVRPAYGSSGAHKIGRRAAGLLDVTPRHLETQTVDRDPCQRCGVRHDIGCKHTRAPVGMVL